MPFHYVLPLQHQGLVSKNLLTDDGEVDLDLVSPFFVSSPPSHSADGPAAQSPHCLQG